MSVSGIVLHTRGIAENVTKIDDFGANRGIVD